MNVGTSSNSLNRPTKEKRPSGEQLPLGERSPEANGVEGVAEEVGKDLEGQAEELGLDSEGPGDSQVSEQGRGKFSVWARKMEPFGHGGQNELEILKG